MSGKFKVDVYVQLVFSVRYVFLWLKFVFHRLSGECFQSGILGRGGLQAIDIAKYQATGPNQHICSLSAAERKNSPFSLSCTDEVRTDFSLVPGSLSYRHAWISLPVRGFLELIHFLNLFWVSLICTYSYKDWYSQNLSLVNCCS